MKNVFFLLLMLLSSATAVAQNTTYIYNFNSGLAEKSGHGTLTSQCTGTFSPEVLFTGLTRSVYHFNKGCGIVFNDAAGNFLSSGNYTIELYCRLDTIQGYKKLLDYDSLSMDKGFYNQSGKLALYPKFTSTDSVFFAGQFQYIALTRNATTKDIYMNCNGHTIGISKDSAGDYIYDSKKLLIFFQDDKNTNTEQAAGAVAMMHISNYVMDSNAIKNNYSNLHSTLDVQAATAAINDITVYPNPASGYVNITTSENNNYALCDITGNVLCTGILKQGDNNISLDKLSAGIYLLKVTNENSAGDKIFKIVKQ